MVYAANSQYDIAQGFDGTYAWVQNGAYLNGITESNGLPTSSTPNQPLDFSSYATNTATNTNTQFEFQPFTSNTTNAQGYYTANNVLLFSGSAMLSLSAGSQLAYNSLAILNASANYTGGYSPVSYVINYTDGTQSSSQTFKSYDWGDASNPTANPDAANSAAFSTLLDRATATGNSVETSAYSKGADYQMYESDINLATLGDNNKSISSITFTGGGGDIGIFAISGVVNPTPVAAPEPAPLAALLCTLTGMILLGRRKTHR